MTSPTNADLTKQLILRWVDTSDVMATQRAIIEVTPEAAYLELPRGKQGEKGEKGDPGPGFWFRALITDRNQLPRNLKTADRGSAFPDTKSKSLWVWDGVDYFEIPNFVGLRGETGAVQKVTVGRVDQGTDAKITVNTAASTEDVTVLDFVLPQGPQGDPGDKGETGDAAAVSSSPDVDVSVPPVPGDALAWNGANWAPRSVIAPVGPFAMGPGNFTSVSQSLIGSGNVSERLIGSMQLPALPFDYRPVVVGGQVRCDFALGLAFDCHVRLGDLQRGDLVGLGSGRAGMGTDVPIQVLPHFAPGVTPGGSFGVVKANQATSLGVVLVKRSGSIGAWKFDRADASLTVLAMPVTQVYG